MEFERYADDAVIHCATEQQARRSSPPSRKGWPESGCTSPGQDQDRVLQGQQAPPQGLRGNVVHVPRIHVPRQARTGPERGRMFTGFLPAASKDALKRMSEEVHSWRIHLRTATELQDIAAWINPVIRGSDDLLRQVLQDRAESPAAAHQLLPGALGKAEYKRLSPYKKARRWWKDLTARQPNLFAHWTWKNELLPPQMGRAE